MSKKVDVSIDKIDETYMRIYCSDGIAKEIQDYFTFKIPNSDFAARARGINPKYWKGDIKLFKLGDRKLYLGLLNKFLGFCRKNGYNVEVTFDPIDRDFDPASVDTYIDYLNLPFDTYDFQDQVILTALEERRALIISPTSSGKSLIMFILSQMTDNPCLIIAPTTSLVSQLKQEFVGYGADPKSIQMIMSGLPKAIECPLVISTWHSSWKQSPDWLNTFSVIIVDEAHTAKASSITSLLETANRVEYKYGLTGTTDHVTVNEMVLQGLFGRKITTTTLREMIDDGICADIEIKCVLLKHKEEDCRRALTMTYEDEKKFLIENKARNDFIVNLGMKTKGNTLTLFERIETHGQKLYEQAMKMPNKKAHYIHGKVAVDVRNEIKRIMEQSETDNSLYASYGTFSTGENVKKMHNIVLGWPSKSRIRVLQSIGRGARLHSSKERLVVWDIADDLSWHSKENITLKHFNNRLDIYDREQLDYKIIEVNL